MENGHQNRLEETKQHGDVFFPFNIYPCTIHRRCTFQISIINSINEFRVLGMCSSFWSINYNF